MVAVLTTPDLKAFRAKIGVARAQVFDIGLLPDPQLAYTLAPPLTAMSGLTSAFSDGINWDVGSLITTITKLRIVKTQAEQVRFDIAWQEWLSANQAKLLASQIYYINRKIALDQKDTTSARHILDVTLVNLKKHNTPVDEYGLRQVAYLDVLDQTITLQAALQKTSDQMATHTLGNQFLVNIESAGVLYPSLIVK